MIKFRKSILTLMAMASVYSMNNFSYARASSDGQNPVMVNLPDFSLIYDSVGKSVVNILVTQSVTQQYNAIGSGDPLFDFLFRRMIPPGQQRHYLSKALGSGFVIGSDGYILTNAHVVKDANSITVKLNDKREFKAKLVGIDTGTDVAVIKIDTTDLPVVKIGDPKQMKPGNWVVAIGSPFGLENTITQGTISSMSRSLPDDTYVPFIQTDVPINPGNSGGPLINLKGEVVGINSQIYSRSGGYMGISFAIPIDYAMSIAKQLKTTGHVVRGRLGVSIQALTPELAKSFNLPSSTNGGVLINSVEVGSPAQKAGLKVGDIVIMANNISINDPTILPRLVSSLGPDKDLDLQIWRNDKTLNIHAVTGNAINSPVTNPNTTKKPIQNIKKIVNLGLLVTELSGFKNLPQGINFALMVGGANNSALNSGIRGGDLILGVGNRATTSLSDFNKSLKPYNVGSIVPLKVLRGDGRQYWSFFVPIKVIKPSSKDKAQLFDSIVPDSVFGNDLDGKNSGPSDNSGNDDDSNGE